MHINNNNAGLYTCYIALKTPAHIAMNSSIDFTKNLRELEWNNRGAHQTGHEMASSKNYWVIANTTPLELIWGAFDLYPNDAIEKAFGKDLKGLLRNS